MASKKPIVAIMYDFDKTLCTKDMQEYGFIPSVKMSASEFWNECTELAKKEKMDKILAYMYKMINISNANSQPVKRANFVKLGENIEFFPGVMTWFERINKFASENNVTVEHYIISSGLKEIIEGSAIKKYFKEIYACEFFYDHNGIAVWPKVAVNYTTKTQFLFRINKGVLDMSNDEALNKFAIENERRVPFGNMIYIGDGLADVPCMKLVKVNGGHSIAVYQKRCKGTVNDLINAQRVDFTTVADYSQNSELEQIVKNIILKVVPTAKLIAMHKKHKKAAQEKMVIE